MLFGATPFYTNVTGSLRLEVQNQTFRYTLFLYMQKKKKQVFLFVLLCFIFNMQFCDHLKVKFKSRETNTGSCFIEILICIAQKLVMATHSLEFQIVYKLAILYWLQSSLTSVFFFRYSPNFLKVFFITVAPCYVFLSLDSNCFFHLLFFPVH